MAQAVPQVNPEPHTSPQAEPEPHTSLQLEPEWTSAEADPEPHANPNSEAEPVPLSFCLSSMSLMIPGLLPLFRTVTESWAEPGNEANMQKF